MKKNKKEKITFKKVMKGIVKYTGLFIVGLFGIVYYTIKDIDSLVAKGFMALKRPFKVAIIYTLIILSSLGVYLSVNDKTPIIKNEIVKVNFTETDSKILAKENEQLKKELEATKSQLQKEKTIKSLNTIERDIYNEAIKQNLTHEQAIMIVSISKHETGNWKSKAFNNKNNFGGVMCRDGLKTYSSYNEGLNHFVSLLKNRYFDKGLNTIEKIGAVYCPVGASNDPTGVNKYWIPNVTKNYNNYVNR